MDSVSDPYATGKNSGFSKNQINNSVNLMNNLVQGKNPYTGAAKSSGKTNKHPQATSNANVPNNAPPPGMPTPGKNGYTPTTAPYGMDQTNPGVQEQFWNQNQNLWTKGAFQGPGQGEQFWNQVQGSFNANNNLQPQFDAAYDRARDKAVGTANAQAASRGVYGSSAALNNVGNVISDVEAARAGAASKFALQNAQNQRDNLSAYGNIAFGAQNAGLANRDFDLNALGAAYAASGAAQNQRDNRIQGAFDNAFRQQQSLLGYYGGQYDNMLGTDYDIYSGATGAGPASTAAGLAAQDRSRAANRDTAGLAFDLYGAYNDYKKNNPSAPTVTRG